MAAVGALEDVVDIENNLVIQELGRFAVDEYNKRMNTLLVFSRVVNAKQQVVSGIKYSLTVEVIEGGEKKLYEAEVWVQAWLNFKQLGEFKPVEEPVGEPVEEPVGEPVEELVEEPVEEPAKELPQ